MINKPYLSMKHIILELVSVVIAVLNLLFVIIMINVRHVDLMAEIHLDREYDFGSLASLLVMAVIFLIGTFFTIIANHFMPGKLYRTPFKINPEKYNIVMYYVTLGTSINMLEVAIWICLLSVIWTLRLDALQVPSVILLLVVAVPTSLFFTIMA
ncbi:MAG: hypothetical protein K6E66_03655, partial [Lachnospiraceae bacterium]|nr:hypothetical protein [Lachnospiraceae bacterium]